MEGVSGKILHIDLNKGLIGEERLPTKWYRDFLGGLGVGVQYLWEDLKSLKPLLEDPIIVMTGPLTGNPLPGTSKASLISYRRESAQLRIGSIEGKFPAYVKMTGVDGLVITGKAKEPISLYLSSKSCKIMDASSIWGKDIFALRSGGGENEHERSVLAIGPAGENGNPYASVVLDQWIHGGVGMGQDFGSKGIKMVFVEPGSELPQTLEPKGLPSWAIAHLKKHFKEVESGEIRRSCFGCVQCCGIFDENNLLYVEEDITKLAALMPQCSKENLLLFYQDCLKFGLEPLETAKLLAGICNQDDISIGFENFVTHHRYAQECIASCSWEEAFLNIQGWYRDKVFRKLEGVSDLIKMENLAMAKNCLPFCERLDMNSEDMLFCLNQVTELDYTSQDLLNMGNILIQQLMDCYHSLNYAPLNSKAIQFFNNRFPPLFKDQLGAYLKERGWENSGFPERL